MEGLPRHALGVRAKGRDEWDEDRVEPWLLSRSERRWLSLKVGLIPQGEIGTTDWRGRQILWSKIQVMLHFCCGKKTKESDTVRDNGTVCPWGLIENQRMKEAAGWD